MLVRLAHSNVLPAFIDPVSVAKISSPLKTAIRPGDPDSGDEVFTK